MVASGSIAPIGSTGREGIVTKFAPVSTSTPCPSAAVSRRYTKPGETVVFFSLAQLANTTSTGNIYAGYHTPESGGSGGFEPRVVKFAWSNLATNQRRDFGGPQGAPSYGFALTGFGTKLLVGGGRTYATSPPGHGQLDAWLGSLTSTLNTCGAPVTETTTAVTLLDGTITFSQASIAIATMPFNCSVNLNWNTNDPCAVSNKTAPGSSTGKAVEAFFDPTNMVDVLNDHEGLPPIKYLQPDAQPATERGQMEAPEQFGFDMYPNPAAEIWFCLVA